MDETAPESPEGPLALRAETVKPEWIDYNGHMNVAYYLLAFDHATDALMDHLGLGIDYVRSAGRSVFVLEVHVTYLAEVGEGDRLGFTCQVLGFDRKRLHIFQNMYIEDGGASGGGPVATMEVMLVHVDLGQRRSLPMPPDILDKVRRLAEDHARLPRPPQAGRVIGLGRKPPTG